MKQETRQKKRVFTKWAERRQTEKCYIAHLHTLTDKYKSVSAFVCVVTPVESVLTLLCEGQGDRPTAGPPIKGAHRVAVNSCLFLHKKLGLCVCVCDSQQDQPR